MVARAILVRQALLMIKLARAARNPAFAALAVDKATQLQARLDEQQSATDMVAEAPAIGASLSR